MRRRSWWSAVIVVAVVAVLAPAARAAGGARDARQIAAEAGAAFRAGRYGEAGDGYAAAFGLRPDPVLLYNAAQSYRLAGNKSRALELYRTYVRLYPDGPNAADAGIQVAALKKVVEDERQTAAALAAPPPAAPASATAPPPADTAPPVAPASDVAPPPAAPPPASARTNPAVPLVSRPAPRAEEKRSITQASWFWVVVGAGVAIVATTLILLGTRDTTYPDPTFGTARGN
jgi:tetratricopeptide (TPR) repeat protein